MAHKKKKKQKRLRKIKRTIADILIGAASGTLAGIITEIVINYLFG